MFEVKKKRVLPYRITVYSNKKVIFAYRTLMNPPHVGELIDLQEFSDRKLGVYRIERLVHTPKKDGTIDIILKVIPSEDFVIDLDKNPPEPIF